MRYKVGVRVPVDLDPRMHVVHEAIEWAWAEVVQDARDNASPQNIAERQAIPDEATITSWGDSTHGPNSYHKRRGRALDVRSKTLPRDLVQPFVMNLRKRVGHIGVDVVLEDFNGVNEHVHVELDARADQ